MMKDIPHIKDIIITPVKYIGLSLTIAPYSITSEHTNTISDNINMITLIVLNSLIANTYHR